MTDPYSVLGITPGADDETIKKAYRQKCKQYHPDLHPNDPTAEEHFKEVQAAYSEIMRMKQGGGQNYGSYGNPQGSYSQQGYGQQSGYSQQYGNPFGGGPAGLALGRSGLGIQHLRAGRARPTPPARKAPNCAPRQLHPQRF